MSLDQVERLDVELQIRQTTDQVVVQASAIGLQTEEATVGRVLDSQNVVELPLNRRSFVQVALLTPGVNPGKKLPMNVYADVGYVGSKATNLTMTFDGNRPVDVVPPGSGVAPLPTAGPWRVSVLLTSRNPSATPLFTRCRQKSSAA